MADPPKATSQSTTPSIVHGAATDTITSALPLPSYLRRQDSAQDSQPWGYASGDPASPLYHSCPSGYSQTVVGIFGVFLGCCRNGVCVNNIEYCAAYLENTSFFTNIYPSWTSCPAETPACVTYTVRATKNDPPIASYACGESSIEIDVARSVAGEVDGSSPARVSASATSLREVGSTASAGLADDGGSSPSHNNSADLVKILVPVIIGVAILLAAAFLFYWKWKRNKERRQDPTRYGNANVLPLKPIRNDRHDNHTAGYGSATSGNGSHMQLGHIYGNVYNYTRRPN